LEAWRDKLTTESMHILDAQLAATYFVQRQGGGAKVCFYYPRGKEIPLFAVQEPDVQVARVTLKTSAGSDVQRMVVKLFVHRGKFFSMEFPKRPERYMEQHRMQRETLQVENVDMLLDLG
jgi:hypothetical protein